MENTHNTIPQKQQILIPVFLVTDYQALIGMFCYKIRLKTEVTGSYLLKTSPYGGHNL